MKNANAWRRSCTMMFIAVFAVTLLGCATPPSVGPLLDVADRALRDESAMLEHDIAQQRDHLAETRQHLAAAFDRDLAETNELDRQWVREAVMVYIEAREALVRHEATLAEHYRLRADNLAVGRQAIERAKGVLIIRDQLLTDPIELAAKRIEERQ